MWSCVKFEIIIYYQISVVLVLIVYHRENTHLLLVQKHLNFIYKPWTITYVHCKYIVSNKPTPPTVHQVLTMSTNECIAMGSTHKCREGYQELLLIYIKVIIHPTVDLSPGHASIAIHQTLFTLLCAMYEHCFQQTNSI